MVRQSPIWEITRVLPPPNRDPFARTAEVKKPDPLAFSPGVRLVAVVRRAGKRPKPTPVSSDTAAVKPRTRKFGVMEATSSEINADRSCPPHNATRSEE